MKLSSLTTLALILIGPATAQAAGLQDAATGMAKEAAQDAATSAAKDAAKSMVPKDVTGAAAAAKDAKKSAEQLKKAPGMAGSEKASAATKSKAGKKEAAPDEADTVPTGEE